MDDLNKEGIKLRLFGWWFAWGAFSTIMLLIVFKGGNLEIWQMFAMVPLGGIAGGIGGLVYFTKRQQNGNKPY